MTRETKIGLLVGLGFIVVFAVLLSQTTSVPSTGENLQIVTKSAPQLPSLPGSREVVNKPSGSAGDRTVPGAGVGRAPESPAGIPDRDTSLVKLPNPVDSSPKGTESAGGRLPNPPSLGPSPLAWTGSGGNSTPLSGHMPPNREEVDVVASGYVDKKAPSPPSSSSVGLALPGTVALVKHPEPTEPGKGAPDAGKPTLLGQPDPVKLPVDPPKEYVVQKGDTLRSIAKDRYDSVSAKVVEFVASTNKTQIKDKNRVFEGQKLVLPDLPADMFEVIPPAGGKKANPKDLSKDLSKELAATDARKGPKDPAKPKGDSATPSPAGTSIATRGNPGAAEASVGGSTQTGDYPKLIPRKKSSSPTATPPSTPAPAPTPVPTPSNVDDRRAPTFIAKNDEGSLKDRLTLDSGEPKVPGGSSKYRTYEIRDKDTLGSIAAKELGTATAWPEIKRLNKDLDPKKMKAGMKIKLPAKHAASSPGGTSSRPEVNRASA
jgi:nucleoid-associated protein YgaU